MRPGPSLCLSCSLPSLKRESSWCGCNGLTARASFMGDREWDQEGDCSARTLGLKIPQDAAEVLVGRTQSKGGTGWKGEWEKKREQTQ